MMANLASSPVKISMRKLQKSKEYLERLNIKDSDLLTIRDEIVAEINQTLYLYQLK
jgi:hypothetical protein